MIYLVFQPSPKMVAYEFFTNRPCWQLAMSNFYCEVLAELLFLLWGVIHSLALFWWLLLFLFQWLLMLLAVCFPCLSTEDLHMSQCTCRMCCADLIVPCLSMAHVRHLPGYERSFSLLTPFVAPIFLTLVAVGAENP